MVKRFCLVVLTIFVFPAFAEVTASLSQNEISELETVELTIRLDGLAPRQEPDFSALTEDFDVLSNQNSSTTKIINNNFFSVAEWRIVLRPKRIASLKIPALNIGNFTTEELDLNVVPISDELSERLDQEVFWIVNVDRQEQYVHGGIHVEHKLYYSDDVTLPGRGRRGAIPVPQIIDDAHLVDLGYRGSNWDLRNGRSYHVNAHESVIFAEKSGSLSIPATSVVAVIDIDGRNVSKVVRSEETIVKILPRPDEYPLDEPWLPATNVLVKDDLTELNLSDLTVGDSFSRRITIEALESYSTGIPGIPVVLPEGMRTYPVTPKFNNQVLGNKIIGTRTDEQAFVVTQAGEFQIPDAELIWWNTNTKQVERTVVPGRTLSVQPNSDSSVASANVDLGGPEPLTTPREVGSNPAPSPTQPLPIWVIVLSLAGWSLSLILASMWYIDRRKEQKATNSTTTNTPQVQALLKSDSGSDVKEGMVRWLTSRLAVSRVAAIQLLQENHTTASVLHNINNSRYSRTEQNLQLDRTQIQQALREIEQHVLTQQTEATSFWQFYQTT